MLVVGVGRTFQRLLPELSFALKPAKRRVSAPCPPGARWSVRACNLPAKVCGRYAPCRWIPWRSRQKGFLWESTCWCVDWTAQGRFDPQDSVGCWWKSKPVGQSPVVPPRAGVGGGGCGEAAAAAAAAVVVVVAAAVAVHVNHWRRRRRRLHWPSSKHDLRLDH